MICIFAPYYLEKNQQGSDINVIFPNKVIILNERLSVEGAIASIKYLAKTCKQIALEKGQIHI